LAGRVSYLVEAVTEIYERSDVMTTCPDCDRELFSERCPCGYHRASIQAGPAIRSTWRATAEGITRAEFGGNLFRAIFVCGEILQAQAYQEVPRVREAGRRAEYRTREVASAKELADVFTDLSQPEQASLMHRYPRLFRGAS